MKAAVYFVVREAEGGDPPVAIAEEDHDGVRSVYAWATRKQAVALRRQYAKNFPLSKYTVREVLL